jgi:threonine aldolase
MPQQFASDNNAGMCPAALAGFIEANAAGHAAGYGDDAWTSQAKERIRTLFAADCEVFFVFNGTAANALALAQICRPYNAVITHAFSHVETDEAGAPEFFSGGAKLMTADTPLAKLTPAAVEALATKGRGPHHVKAKALSLTQATEFGTVYTGDELRDLTAVARRHGLRVHMDGARFANAVARLGCRPADISWRAGVDVLCFGGVKNGLAVGECVVFFDRALAEEFIWRLKQAGHLNSKMRLVSAAWLGLLDNEVWLANARHANAMADRLAAKIKPLPGVKIMAPVEANAVFAEIAPGVQAALRQKGWQFYTFLGATGCRLMCAWDTEPATVDRFAADMANAEGLLQATG